MSPAIVMITSMHWANVGISLSSLVFCASILLSTRVQVFREIYVGKSRWGFTVSAGAVEISKMRRHSPSPSFASRVPIPTFFRHWSRQQGGFSCSAIIQKSQSDFQDSHYQMCSLPLACLSTVVPGQRRKRQKSRPELWSIAHWDIGHSSAGPSWSHLPPAAPNLHSAAFPSQCKTQPTPTGLEDKYFPWKGHKWDKLGHCKMGCFSPTQNSSWMNTKHMMAWFLKYFRPENLGLSGLKLRAGW